MPGHPVCCLLSAPHEHIRRLTDVPGLCFQDLTAGAATFDLVEDSTHCLRLTDVQVTDAGTYTVVAANRHGSAQRTMSLEVTGKGQLWVELMTGKGQLWVERVTGKGQLWVERVTGKGQLWVELMTGKGQLWVERMTGKGQL